jgi:uncharacterized membrane protein YgcG
MFPRFMYHNHAQIHHVAFTDGNMSFHDMRELSLIMMPWYTIVLLLVTVSPVAIAAGLLGGLPMVGVFYVAALGYFLTYETLHALYHVPPDRMVRLGLGGLDDVGGAAPARRGVFGALRAHHRHHHIMRRMAHVNFNVTFPLADVVMGTRERPDAVVAAPGRPKRPASRLAAASAGGGAGGSGGGGGRGGGQSGSAT